MSRMQCPDAAQMAAFLEGRLPQGERMRVLRHLDECEDCLEWVCEVERLRSADGEEADSLEEDSQVEPPRPTAVGRGFWVGVAAAVLIAGFFAWSGAPDGGRGELARMVDPLAKTGLLPRSTPGFASPLPAVADFPLGVAIVGLYAAALEDRPAEVRRMADQILALLAATGRREGWAASALRRPLTPERVLEIDERLEATTGLDYSSGRWAQTLLLAAESGDLDYLLSPATEELMATAKPRFPARVQESLRDLKEARDSVERADRLLGLRQALREWIHAGRRQ